MENPAEKSKDFIRTIIEEDLKTGKNGNRVETRFPPEPNGYLHIGHAKAICIDFGIANEYNGACHLRMDDTNPAKEEVEYVDSIMQDVKWLGFDWGKHFYYASDYYEQLYKFAIELIEKNKAYVCDLNTDEIRQYRGTLTEPGKNSPFRNRTAEENLNLFEKMKNGEFKDGQCALRAKIDMAHPNLNMRDPVIYRIKHTAHHRTGNKWCIYPTYDYAHPVSDALEKITHSICTLEFEDHRPLYNWVIENITIDCHPQQIEFARLNITYTVMSKRKLLTLVQEKLVNGWDDPRLPTISGLRRRGYTPEAIRNFCERIGVAKANSTVDLALLEHCIREDLNKNAHRVMVVLDPVKVVITNYPDNQTEEFEADNNPEDPSAGKRKIMFSKEIYIERDDFREVPPKKYFRLAPGQEVRLKHAYYITCENVIKDTVTGEITEIHCKLDPQSRGGSTPDNRRVQGTLHWVSVKDAVNAEVMVYENLFTKADPDNIKEGEDFKSFINPASLKVLSNAKAEPALLGTKPGNRYQFLRNGYFCTDTDSTTGNLVFNRIVTLKDTWAKVEKKN
ncbi:MAG: glutamine--tRNA ligase [Elusimicrobia bacterium RIFOXYA2_FULL_39_19]|nr:MAG: glutamine--tRNA ligase [Elusimicrobia bacterium RIFOXYA2_FULL_39_19]